MRTYPECILCLVRIINMNLGKLDLDIERQTDLMKESLKIVSSSDLRLPSPVIAGKLYKLLQEVSGEEDLYRDYKKKSTELSLALYPQMKRAVSNSEDRLITAMKICALGNLLDVANPNAFDLEKEISNISEYRIEGDGLKDFLDQLNSATQILILADNAGETVFDRVLIEELDIPVIYAVRGGPAYNDAGLEEALLAGLDGCAEIISNGSDIPGTYLPTCSQDFLDLFNQSDLILAKGQGNYETLSDQARRDIFFLMKIKCSPIEKEIGYSVGSIVLKRGGK